MEDWQIQKLIQENRELRERVFKLEEQLGLDRRQLERETSQVTQVVKLLQQKDVTLEEYAAQLEEKRDQLEKSVTGLEKKNQQLQVWVSALKLYQDMLENETSALIGVSKEGKIVLYNKATLKMFGEEFRNMVGKELDAVDFSIYDPYTPRLVEAVMKNNETVDRRVEIKDQTIHTFAYPMGKGSNFRGVLLKISVQQ